MKAPAGSQVHQSSGYEPLWVDERELMGRRSAPGIARDRMPNARSRRFATSRNSEEPLGCWGRDPMAVPMAVPSHPRVPHLDAGAAHTFTLCVGSEVLTGRVIIAGEWFAAGWALLAEGPRDVFTVGRETLRPTEAIGAFMDSVFDRSRTRSCSHACFWALADDGRRLDAALALFTLVVSLSVSHIRAEAEAVGVQLTEGFFQRLERFIALLIGLVVPGAMTPILVILAVLGAVTALQRGWAALVRA